ncbi:hypothetical protein E3T55_19325 [Cryobacterium frigoriphilum]|uniref:Lipoprotein LpqB N-terminal domain-containing protein n=1 Tax=Cryobacterium frigoriphilum TaxID=1259150 RepID=A0A4R8ZTS2_9MICO|nr:hypothetical protein [Cryobacterium frigoriphilum]TFD45173.1 hypothetical protein E3T55_19325 [Cryobacterium frigoriphilum]
MKPPRPDRTLLIVLGVIAVLVVVSLVVVFSRGEPEALDPATPEGVVQRYSAAVIAGDETAAMEYLAPEVREDCERFTDLQADNLRVVLVSTTERDSSADVRVSIVTTYEGNGPFGSSEFESERTFDLVTVDGEWLIDGSPWELAVCTNAARN